MNKENTRKMFFILIWFVFLLGGIYEKFIGKLIIMVGSAYLASKIAWLLIPDTLFTEGVKK